MKKPAARPQKKQSLATKSPILKPKISAGQAVFSLSVKNYGLEPILGAAYMMMDRMFVALAGDSKKTIQVSLRAKPDVKTPMAVLAKDFAAELRTQELRWALAKNNLPVREFIAEQAVLLANGRITPPAAAPEEPAAEELSVEQKSEIEKLIAEVEAEIKTMNEAKTKPAAAVADPKGIAASWEEKQETRAREGGA